MPEEAPTTSRFTTIGDGQADGYCDPVTGACVWPGAAVSDDESVNVAPPASLPDA